MAGLFIAGAARSVDRYKVVLLAGQSNSSGYGHYRSLVGMPTNPYVMQLSDGSSGPAILADEPLDTPDKSIANGAAGSDRMGHGLSFARNYLSRLPPNTGVMLVPAAYGATALVGSVWASGSPGGAEYENAITQVGRALALNAGNTFAGVLWHQGEQDIQASVASATYQTALDAMIDGYRARITGGASSWFILGDHVPEWVGADSLRLQYQAVFADTPNRKTKCAHWAGATGHNEGLEFAGNNIHYSALGQLANGVSAYNAGVTAGLF